jgi:hypothetical protein
MNVGQLFREFNEYRHLFNGDKTIDENVDVYTREKLKDFLKIVSDENVVVEKLKVFVGQQYKKLSKSKDQDEKQDKVIKTEEPIQENKPEEQTDIKDKEESNGKIFLREGVYLLIEGNKRIMTFPNYTIIY